MLVEKIDAALLNKAQGFADRFQTLSGKTKFFLEKWSLILGVFCYGTWAINEGSVTLVVLASLLLIAKGVEVILIERQEANFISKGNLEITRTPSARQVILIMMLTILTIGIIFCLMDYNWSFFCLWTIFNIAQLYFQSCIPKPPSKSKFSMWWEKTLWKIHDALEPKGAPAKS